MQQQQLYYNAIATKSFIFNFRCQLKPSVKKCHAQAAKSIKKTMAIINDEDNVLEI